MSGKPSVEGVANFRRTLSIFAEAKERIDTLERQIRERSEELKLQREVSVQSMKELMNMMEQMDIKSEGNHGYEGRIAWFYAELFKQMQIRETA